MFLIFSVICPWFTSIGQDRKDYGSVDFDLFDKLSCFRFQKLFLSLLNAELAFDIRLVASSSM